MNTTSNFTQDLETPFSFKPSFAYPVAVCYIVVIAVAIVGNLMVCYAIITNTNLRHNPSNLLLLSLAVADFLTAILAMPFDVESLFLNFAWKHGKALCLTWQLVYLFVVPISIFSLLVIIVDRYLTLSGFHGRFGCSRFMTKQRALIVIATIWLYSILWALLPVMGWRKEGDVLEDGICMIPYTKAYNIASSFLNIVLPLQVSCGFSILVYHITRKHEKALSNTEHNSSEQPTKEQQEIYLKNIKAAKRSSVFVLAIFVCWQPYALFVVVDTINSENWTSFHYEVYMVLLMFGYLNSALNPFLFAFRNKHFRDVYAKMCSTSTHQSHLSIQHSNATELDKAEHYTKIV
ncbi:histamine H1 receptor-like [Stylophora pistillata]|uniref:histamine H1 receptor-like n=1 Tax=Stylophora pistillata TaxID=50429 RepID=UPI000C0390A0|nr:histamine H1 receptor-like [Stylophora pistillata]